MLRRPRPSSRLCIAWLAAVAVGAGCRARDAGELVVLTNLSTTEADRIGATFLDWASPRIGDTTPLTSVRWVHVPDRTDPARALLAGARADVVLGASADGCRELEVRGLLADRPAGISGASVPFRVRDVGLLLPDGAKKDRPPIAVDDPRVDRPTLELIAGHLRRDGWRTGWISMLRRFGTARPIGIVPGSAAARLDRGERSAVPAFAEESARATLFRPEARIVEHAAVIAGSSHEAAARLFVEYLMAHQRPVGRAQPVGPGGTDGLLADLLGATLVDSRVELVAALASLDLAGRPPKAEAWLVPPPWPPASVAKLAAKDPSGELVGGLLAQIAPDLEARTWLQESWKRSEQPIDDATLDELAEAADGRLIREERFRTWLREEWTAWSRQRYRRVARESGKAAP